MRQNRYAVIIGVSNYDDDLQQLPYAGNDAIRLYSTLTRIGGFEPQNTFLLVDKNKSDIPARTPTRANILQAVQHIVESANDDDLLFIYFAGHGSEISQIPYLITEDTKLNVVNHTAINVNELNEILEKTKASSIVRVFDACRNAFQLGRSVTGRMSQGLQDAFMKKASGWVTISSCSTGEVANESAEFEQGVFSFFLCNGLEGEAKNDNGEVTAERLVDYTKISVQNWCNTKMKKQTPHLLSDLSGTLVLSKVDVEEETTSVQESNPLAGLVFGLDSHIRDASPDIQNLSFTDEQQLPQVFNIVSSHIKKTIEGFSHPFINIIESNVVSLNGFGKGTEWNEFVNTMNRLNVNKEHKGDRAVRLTFTSSNVIVPTTDLYISAVRFSFFYWIWWIHVCNNVQLQNRFNPEPLFFHGFFTFRPLAALDENKTERVIADIFNQCSGSIIKWAEQLKEFVNSRVDPLRNIGDVIS